MVKDRFPPLPIPNPIEIQDVSGLTARLKALEALSGDLTDWEPTLVGATTNPNLGAGGNVVGQYQLVNGWCHAWARWFWSGAGVSGGSGVYSVAPPLPVHADLNVSSTTYGGATVGHGGGRDDSATSASRACRVQASSSTAFVFHSVDAVAFWSDAVPFAWGAAGDRLSIYLAYPVAV